MEQSNPVFFCCDPHIMPGGNDEMDKYPQKKYGLSVKKGNVIAACAFVECRGGDCGAIG